jgi:hypothetical protein
MAPPDAVAVAAPGRVDLADDLVDDDGHLVDDLADDLGDDEPVPVIDADQVRRFLSGLGAALGFALADPDVPEHWRFTDAELDELGPAIAGMANRRPALARAIDRSDHMVVAMHLARYAGRNIQAGRRARNAREEVTDGRNGQAHAVGGYGFATAEGAHGD